MRLLRASQVPAGDRIFRSSGCLAAWMLLAWAGQSQAGPKSVAFSQSAGSIEAYEYVEVVARIENADAANPFVDAALSGTFARAGDNQPVRVDGFCDASDGSIFRIRFMPASAGEYNFAVDYVQAGATNHHLGRFQAVAGH